MNAYSMSLNAIPGDSQVECENQQRLLDYVLTLRGGFLIKMQSCEY